MRHCLRLSALILLFLCSVQCAHGTGLDSSTIQKRLSKIEKSIPLPYHTSLANDIKSYSSKQLPVTYSEYAKLIGDALVEQKLTEELLYLPMAMTNMKLDYRHGNRAGIWALPELVAIRYGLTVNGTHDERFSVETSTRAALLYLRDLYESHGDWWQSLLAYANSPASINRARLRSPEDDPSDPWSYYDEQRVPDVDIIGDFIACYYVYSSDDKSVSHSTEAYAYCDFDRPMAVSAISTSLNVPEKTLKSLNPIFLTEQFLPFNGYQLRLPVAKAQVFESKKNAIYEQTIRIAEEKERQAKIAAEEKEKAKEQAKKEPEYITYTVKKGDTLGGIAQRYHVKIKDIKRWNNLKSDMIREKQQLKIYK